MIVLLHGDDPGDIIERNSAETEIGIVGNSVDLLDERVEVRGLDAVDGRDEVCR